MLSSSYHISDIANLTCTLIVATSTLTMQQRSKLKCGTLTEKRIAKLNELDFTWDCRKNAMSEKIGEASAEHTLDNSDDDEV